MKAFLNVINKISKAGFWLAALGLAIVTLMIVLDITLRVFGVPLFGTYEIVEFSMAIIVFASFAYTQTEKGHIHVTMFINVMPQKLRFVCFALTSFISTFVVGYISYAAFKYGSHAMGSGSASSVLAVPHFPFYFIEGAAMALFTIVLLVDACKALLAIFNADVAKEIQSSWV